MEGDRLMSEERASKNKEKMNDQAIELVENGEILSPIDEKLTDNDIPERETWGKKVEFILACVGYAVGLGNVWRFPYLAFKNGGGAFLIPYFTMLFLCGMPLFFMELAIGQYFSLGPVTTWSALCPISKGVGFAMMMVSFLCTIYYNVIIAWVLYYMYESFKSEVPWKKCGNWWNTILCEDDYEALSKKVTTCTAINGSSGLLNGTVLGNLTTIAPSATALLKTTTQTMVNATINGTMMPGNCSSSVVRKNFSLPSKEFFDRYVLRITDSISETGEMRFELVAALVVAWILVYCCLFKGIKSSGKVVYFTATFPYLLMTILIIRGATLDGAGDGIKFYLSPDFSRLADAKVWVAAATQIFYSLGIGFGSLIAFGSYNKFHNDVVRDAVAVSLVNCCTSVYAGAAIFCVLGHMAKKIGVPIEEVATQGPGLAFVVYPEGIANMPISPLWAILFFFMILTLGLDTQFAMMEAVITGLSDEYPKYLRKYKSVFTGIICAIAFLLGLPHVTQGGMYILNLFDSQSGGVSLLFLAFFESLALAYGYGANRFEEDIACMLKRKPLIWWKLCWRYFSPGVILAIFIFSFIQWTGLSYGTYNYPAWAEVIGWSLAFISMVWIPGYAIYICIKTPGSRSDKFYKLFTPDPDAQKRVEKMNNLSHRPSQIVKL